MVHADNHDRLYAKGRTGEKVGLVAINTGAELTVARQETVAGLPERAQSPKFALQMA